MIEEINKKFNDVLISKYKNNTINLEDGKVMSHLAILNDIKDTCIRYIQNDHYSASFVPYETYITYITELIEMIDDDYMIAKNDDYIAKLKIFYIFINENNDCSYITESILYMILSYDTKVFSNDAI